MYQRKRDYRLRDIGLMRETERYGRGTGEIQGRYRRDIEEIQKRYRRDTAEIQQRYK